VKVAVIGAGTMGGGIAYVAALSGCEVALSDAAAPALPRAMQSIEALLAGGLKRGKLTEDDRAGVRSRLHRASPGWLLAGVGLEILSCLSYVVVFRAVFCRRMGWRLSYQIGMAEQAANSLLPVSGTPHANAACSTPGTAETRSSARV